MHKRLILALSAMTIAAMLLTGCGSNNEEDKVDIQLETVESSTEVEPEIISLTDEENEPLPDLIGTITIGTVGDVYTDVLNQAVSPMREEGYELIVKTYDDYFTPYDQLAAGEIDCVLCTHSLFLSSYNRKYGTELSIVDDIYYTPYRLYAGKSSSLDDVKSGSTIVIPEDTVGMARALYMLEDLGLVTIATDVRSLPNIDDVEEYLTDIDITADSMDDMNNLASSYDYLIADSNEAMSQCFDVLEGALYTERADADSLDVYGTVLVVNSQAVNTATEDSDEDADEDSDEDTEEDVEETSESLWQQVLSETLRTGEVRDYLYNNYHGTIIVCRDVVVTSDEETTEETTEESEE